MGSALTSRAQSLEREAAHLLTPTMLGRKAEAQTAIYSSSSYQGPLHMVDKHR